jgi:hypothetical protein
VDPIASRGVLLRSGPDLAGRLGEGMQLSGSKPASQVVSDHSKGELGSFSLIVVESSSLAVTKLVLISALPRGARVDLDDRSLGAFCELVVVALIDLVEWEGDSMMSMVGRATVFAVVPGPGRLVGSAAVVGPEITLVRSEDTVVGFEAEDTVDGLEVVVDDVVMVEVDPTRHLPGPVKWANGDSWVRGYLI